MLLQEDHCSACETVVPLLCKSISQGTFLIAGAALAAGKASPAVAETPSPTQTVTIDAAGRRLAAAGSQATRANGTASLQMSQSKLSDDALNSPTG